MRLNDGDFLPLYTCNMHGASEEFTIYTKHTFAQYNYVMKSVVIYMEKES